MAFEPVVRHSTRSGANTVTIDRYRRLTLSQAARRELKLEPYQHVVVSVDVANKRIGIVKQDVEKVPNATAVKMDKRGNLGVIGGQIAEKLRLPVGVRAYRFEYVGRIDEAGVYWHAWELIEEDEETAE